MVNIEVCQSAMDTPFNDFATPTSETHIKCKFSPLSGACAKFHAFEHV